MIERSFSAAVAWIVLCVLAGFGFMFIGPGVATVFAAAALGVCGAVVHVTTYLLGIRLRYWYAGIIIGVFTSATLGIFLRGDFLKLELISILTVLFAVVASIVFPIAQWCLEESNESK